MAIADVRRRDDVLLVSWVMSHCPEDQALMVLENRIIVDATAWTRKYLIVASIARGW